MLRLVESMIFLEALRGLGSMLLKNIFQPKLPQQIARKVYGLIIKVEIVIVRVKERYNPVSNECVKIVGVMFCWGSKEPNNLGIVAIQ